MRRIGRLVFIVLGLMAIRAFHGDAWWADFGGVVVGLTLIWLAHRDEFKDAYQ